MTSSRTDTVELPTIESKNDDYHPETNNETDDSVIDRKYCCPSCCKCCYIKSEKEVTDAKCRCCCFLLKCWPNKTKQEIKDKDENVNEYEHVKCVCKQELVHGIIKDHYESNIYARQVCAGCACCTCCKSEESNIKCSRCTKVLHDDSAVYHCPAGEQEAHNRYASYRKDKETEKEKEKKTDKKEETQDNGYYDLCISCVEELYGEKRYEIATTLEQDIWSLAYVIAKNRQMLPSSYCLLLAIIYIVQVTILCVMIWSYRVMLNKDVEMEYYMEGDCILDLNLTTVIPTNVECGNMTLIKDHDYVQTWSDVPYKTGNDNTFSLTYGQILVFPWSSVLSFILLSVYIFSSMTNPAIMAQIAEEIEVRLFSCYPLLSLHVSCQYLFNIYRRYIVNMRKGMAQIHDVARIEYAANVHVIQIH